MIGSERYTRGLNTLEKNPMFYEGYNWAEKSSGGADENQIHQTRAFHFLPLLSCHKHPTLFPAVSQIQYYSARADFIPGRTQVAKPLAAVSAGLTAATTSTRTKPRLSAAITSAERRKSAKLTSTVDVLAKVPCQVGIEKRTVSVRHISTKPKSQPLKPHLSKEPSEKPTAKEIVSMPLKFSDFDECLDDIFSERG